MRGVEPCILIKMGSNTGMKNHLKEFPNKNQPI